MAREIVRLSAQERELLAKHYGFYQSLASGNRLPRSTAQHHFVAVCRGEAQPATDHEQTWLNFRRLLALTKVCERQVVEDGFRLEVPIPEEVPAEAPGPAPAQEAEVDLSEFDEFGEGVPRPGWFSDEGWRRMRAGYRYDSRRGPA